MVILYSINISYKTQHLFIMFYNFHPTVASPPIFCVIDQPSDLCFYHNTFLFFRKSFPISSAILSLPLLFHSNLECVKKSNET